MFMSGSRFQGVCAAIGIGAIAHNGAVFRVIDVLADHVTAIVHRQVQHGAIPDVGRWMHFHERALSVGRQMDQIVYFAQIFGPAIDMPVAC